MNLAIGADDLTSDMPEDAWWRASELAEDISRRLRALEDRLPNYVMHWRPETEPDGPTPKGGAR